MYGLYQIMYFTLIDIINTVLSPFFIAIFFIILYQYYKIGKSEYSLSINKSSFLLNTLNSTIFGIFGGVISTVTFIYLEVVIVPLDFMYIFTAAIVLAFINPRFMCFAYGGGLVCLLSLIIGIPKIQVTDIMTIVAGFHMVESLLILLNGYKGINPAYFEHKDDYVGGFNINRLWAIPFVVFIGDGLIKPIALMAILSYGDFTLAHPRRKTIFTSILMFFYSILLLYIIRRQSYAIIAPLFAIIGHEFIIHLNRIIEKSRTPIFTNSKKGVRVIDIHKHGIANEIGINIGDVIISINENGINNEKDIQEIENLRIGIIKIKYFNKTKGLITKKYEGNKKSLGIAIVPRVIN